MQRKTRCAAQGGPLCQHCNAAMRPFSFEPSGQPREPAAYVVAAPCRGTTTARHCA